MNQALAPYFPERSLEAIKSLRKKAEHQKLLSDIITDIKNAHNKAEPLLSLEISQSDVVTEGEEKSSENQELKFHTYIHSLPDIDIVGIK
ncbi:hypothetical protein GWI33_021174, partial [Rhynchophorus ferrugineus]